MTCIELRVFYEIVALWQVLSVGQPHHLGRVSQYKISGQKVGPELVLWLGYKHWTGYCKHSGTATGGVYTFIMETNLTTNILTPNNPTAKYLITESI